MDEILCLEKFEGADVTDHSAVVFSNSSPEIPKLDKSGSKFKKKIFKKYYILTNWMVKSSMTIVFSSCTLKIDK